MKKKIEINGGNREATVDPNISKLVIELMNAWINVDAKYSRKLQLVSLLFRDIEGFKKFCLILQRYGEFDPFHKLHNSVDFDESISDESIWSSQLIVGMMDDEILAGVDLHFPISDIEEVTQAFIQNNKKYKTTKNQVSNKSTSKNQVECDWLKKVCEEIKQESVIPRNRIFGKPNNN